MVRPARSDQGLICFTYWHVSTVPALSQGNAHAKRSLVSEEPIADDTFHVGSPPMSPGSPLTYSLQVAMEPLAKADDLAGGRPATEFVGAAGWPAQPKLVPVVIVCEYLMARQEQQRLSIMHSAARACTFIMLSSEPRLYRVGGT